MQGLKRYVGGRIVLYYNPVTEWDHDNEKNRENEEGNKGTVKGNKNNVKGNRKIGKGNQKKNCLMM